MTEIFEIRTILAVSALAGCCVLGAACTGDGDGAPDSGDGGDGGVAACERRVLAHDVTNARDLGDHPLADGGRVACGAVLRGGDLSSLTDDGCGEMADLGIKTVVDLRMETTQASAPAAGCVSGEGLVVSAAMPKLLPPTNETYVALMEETEAVASMFGALGKADALPAYVHCVIGRDRASFATALVLLALGADRQTVIDEFELSNDAGIAVETEWIEAVLDDVDGRGGIEAYLDSAGVSSEHLASLREQAVATGR